MAGDTAEGGRSEGARGFVGLVKERGLNPPED